MFHLNLTLTRVELTWLMLLAGLALGCMFAVATVRVERRERRRLAALRRVGR